MTKNAMWFLKEFSNAVCKADFISIAETPKHKSLICDYFKSVPKAWKIIKNEKDFFFAHKIALVKS
jgi:hypothetical protein